MRQRIKARDTASTLLNLSKGSSLAERQVLDPEIAVILDRSRAEAPKAFVPGQNKADNDGEDGGEGGGKRSRRNSNLPQELRLSIRYVAAPARVLAVLNISFLPVVG